MTRVPTSMQPIDAGAVARAHDAMAEEYDVIDDLWYQWLYTQVHDFIATHLAGSPRTEKSAVDAGCGTGFQTFLLALAGYNVTGFDIADALLDRARWKTPEYCEPAGAARSLFSGSDPPPWVLSHHRRMASRLEGLRGGRPVQAPHFVHADIRDFDFGRGRLDVITCCGSVLSFVDDYRRVLGRMAEGLAPGGSLFLEVEQRYNLDLIWPILDRLLGGRLHYDQSWQEIGRNLGSPLHASVRIDYPFEYRDGNTVMLPIWLFSACDLKSVFGSLDLTIAACAGIHQITNLLPSTSLHAQKPSPFLRAAFEPLRRADGLVAQLWPFRGLGCSVMYCLRRGVSE